MDTTTEQAWEAFHVPLYQFIRRRVADEARQRISYKRSFSKFINMEKA